MTTYEADRALHCFFAPTMVPTELWPRREWLWFARVNGQAMLRLGWQSLTVLLIDHSFEFCLLIQPPTGKCSLQII